MYAWSSTGRQTEKRKNEKQKHSCCRILHGGWIVGIITDRLVRPPRALSCSYLNGAHGGLVDPLHVAADPRHPAGRHHRDPCHERRTREDEEERERDDERRQLVLLVLGAEMDGGRRRRAGRRGGAAGAARERARCSCHEATAAATTGARGAALTLTLSGAGSRSR